MKKLMAMLVAVASLAGCTAALLPPNVVPVVAKSTSVAQASRKLEQVAIARAAIEAEFAASEQVCYTKFFVNNCLDTAKEKRRGLLAYQNAVEDEADFFRRKATVDERDREVAKAVKDFEAEEARAAAQPPAPPRADPKSLPPAPKASLVSRSAKRDAKLAERAAQDAADAPKRAAKAKEFEQRKLDAEKRQREVAEKMAEKAAKAEGK
ncbi:MAG: hypothetical protein V4631_03890 [Pseudomonadota bacterium]